MKVLVVFLWLGRIVVSVLGIGEDMANGYDLHCIMIALSRGLIGNRAGGGIGFEVWLRQSFALIGSGLL